VLTKALGTGVILAADMQACASAKAVEAAYEMMLQSSREIAQTLRTLNPSAVTDVTGFGLLGHLLEMMSASADSSGQLGAVVKCSAVPLLDGALDLVEAGFQSTLYPHLQPYTLQCDIQSTDQWGLTHRD